MIRRWCRIRRAYRRANARLPAFREIHGRIFRRKLERWVASFADEAGTHLIHPMLRTAAAAHARAEHDWIRG